MKLVKNLANEDARIRERIYLIIAVYGSQEKLCRELKMSLTTLNRRMNDPGELKLSELRKLTAIANKKGIEFNLIGGNE